MTTKQNQEFPANEVHPDLLAKQAAEREKAEAERQAEASRKRLARIEKASQLLMDTNRPVNAMFKAFHAESADGVTKAAADIRALLVEIEKLYIAR